MKSLSVFIASSTLLACCACFACSTEKPANDSGPAQQAGATVDQGADDAQESAKEAGQKAADTAKKAADKSQEKTGDSAAASPRFQ